LLSTFIGGRPASPETTLVIAGLALLTTLWPISRLGGEFLPQMDEGDLLYMPSALPGLSASKVRNCCNKLIA